MLLNEVLALPDLFRGLILAVGVDLAVVVGVDVVVAVMNVDVVVLAAVGFQTLEKAEKMQKRFFFWSEPKRGRPSTSSSASASA